MGREVGGGSGWGAHVYPWQIHVDVWQNQYNIVKKKKKESLGFMSLLSTWGFLRLFLISQAIRKETEEEHAPEVSALHQEDGQDWQSRCY